MARLRHQPHRRTTHGLLNTYCGPQFRPQENYTLGLLPELLATATPRLKELVGLKVWNGYGRFDTPAVELISHDQFVGELNPNVPESTKSLT